MHIAIVDDEIAEINNLSNKVKAYLDKLPLKYEIFVFTSGEELLKADCTFDVVFLDIQMKELSGMAAAKKLRSAGVDSFIVFVTVLQEYVFDAFEVSASDYLLKPVEDARLARLMDRICQSISEREKSSLAIFSRGNNCTTISLHDILYCEAVNHKINIHTKNQIHDSTFKIEQLEARLDYRFFKCHRSYLVNLDYVCGYKDGLAHLENGEKIPVSRLRGQEFALKILQYMKKKGC